MLPLSEPQDFYKADVGRCDGAEEEILTWLTSPTAPSFTVSIQRTTLPTEVAKTSLPPDVYLAKFEG